MSDRYRESRRLLDRALRTIPLGAQTFSKSTTQYPRGIAPHFIIEGRGARVRDPDGHEYLDFVNGLLAVSLGHADPDVERAVVAQLRGGVSHSLSHPVEIDVAEAIVRLVPCAEMVRFGKNGSDATAGAIRLARAVTGRERVAVCGYHGWQDWYIGSTSMDLGVPRAVRELTHRFEFNRLETLAATLEAHPGAFAAVILEPMSTVWPADGFLAGVRDLSRDHGALLVFDETITGFRFALGGAQELFGVTPDLATFGKGLANGFPLSVLAGRRELMEAMGRIFFSFTFGGETVSLAAARAVLAKLEREPVLATIAERGRAILTGLDEILGRRGIDDVFATSGHPSWSFLAVRPDAPGDAAATRTLVLQEILARGILSLGSHNISYAHSEDDVARLLAVYDEVLPAVAGSARAGTVGDRLRCEPLRPLFRPRS